MLEGEYLELVNQLKDQFNEKDKEVIKMQEEVAELKKCIISAYGFIRIVDMVSEHTELDYEVKNMIEILRTYLSDSYDNFF